MCWSAEEWFKRHFANVCFPANRKQLLEAIMTKRIARHARVSNDKQTVDNQPIELRNLCERLGYTIVQEYTGNPPIFDGRLK